MGRLGGAAEAPVLGEQLEVVQLAEGWEHDPDIEAAYRTSRTD
jgi:hypothetical protein